MTRLYLLRHAKSSWDEPGLADRDRPLAPRGRRGAERIAEHLRAENVRLDLVLCSPALRARRTLEIVRDGFPDVRVHEHPFEDFGAQRNWALEHTAPRHEWILFIDADEFMEGPLVEEIAVSAL